MKFIKILFFIITFLSLFWFLITLTPIELDEFGKEINPNILIDNIKRIYNSGIPPLLFILISFTSLIFAILDTRKVYKQKPIKINWLMLYLFLVLTSLGIMILNLWTHYHILREIFAG